MPTSFFKLNFLLNSNLIFAFVVVRCSSVKPLKMLTVEIRHVIKQLKRHQQKNLRLNRRRYLFSIMIMKKAIKIPLIPWIQHYQIRTIVLMLNWAIQLKTRKRSQSSQLSQNYYVFFISSREQNQKSHLITILSRFIF